MDMRKFIEKLDAEKRLVHVKKQVSTEYEMAEVLAALDGRPVIFENVRGHKMKVVGNLYSDRELMASALATKKELMLEKISKAIGNLKEPRVRSAQNGQKTCPCQEVIMDEVDLSKLPIMKYLKSDGGAYVPSAIVIVKDPKSGRNVCFHRLMVTGKDTFTARIVENRGTWNALANTPAGQELECAIVIGNSAAVLLAASTSLKSDEDEFALANALESNGGGIELARCRTVDLEVPADSEIVLEGKITRTLSKEGPFLDLTCTIDHERMQPVVKIQCVTMRKDAIYQTLLPGLLEHKVLMGMPKEPTIFNEVNKVAKCRNVLLSPGGNSWLHAIVQIEKRGADDGMKAIEAAFKGHGSLKHCVVVDSDVDIYDPVAVENAVATRFQADKGLVVMKDQPSSSLDPSATQKPGEKAKTAKMGIDATIPFGRDKSDFVIIEYPHRNLKDYI